MVVRSVVRRGRLKDLGVSKATFGAAGELGPVGATVDIPSDKKIKTTVTVQNTGSQRLEGFVLYARVSFADTLSDSTGDPESDFNTWHAEEEASAFTSRLITLDPGASTSLDIPGVDASTWVEGTIIDAGVVIYTAEDTTVTYLDSLKVTDAVRIIAPALRVEITDVTFSETE